MARRACKRNLRITWQPLTLNNSYADSKSMSQTFLFHVASATPNQVSAPALSQFWKPALFTPATLVAGSTGPRRQAVGIRC